MKKLMIAMAAMTAGVALADVTSANIVGYTNKAMEDGGQLVSASFLNPGKETFRVSDIKITGYEEDEMYYQSQDYNANFFILDSYGRTNHGKDQYFEYVDVWDWDAYAFLGGKWYNNGALEGEEIVPGGDADYELSAGQSVWLNNPGGGAKAFTFNTAGEVITGEVPVPLADGGNCVGNPMAVDVWVSDLAITGYEEDEMYYQSQDYSANFFILDSYGRTNHGKDQYFEYVDVWDWDAYAFLGGKWYNNGALEGEEIVPYGFNDFKIAPGQGLWFSNPGGGDESFTLLFPKVVNVD